MAVCDGNSDHVPPEFTKKFEFFSIKIDTLEINYVTHVNDQKKILFKLNTGKKFNNSMSIKINK